VVGILESLERERRAPLFFECLFISNGSDDLGGESVATSHFAGDLSLFHSLRGIEATEENE
jgi:hypothetical protein